MANGTYYADGVNGSDANDGLSEATAKQTLAAGVGLFSGGGNKLYVQATGNYVLTATVSVATSGDTTNGRNIIEGYTTTPGALDGRPTITSATNSVNLFTLPGSDFITFRHLKLTHTAATRGAGLHNTTGTSTNVAVADCLFDGCSQAISSVFSWTSLSLIATSVLNSVSHGMDSVTSVYLWGCYFRGNGGTPVRTAAGWTLHAQGCVFAANNYGLHYETSGWGGAYMLLDRCTFYGNTVDGLRFQDNQPGDLVSLSNCIFYGNGSYGVRLDAGATNRDAVILFNRNNAYGSNTSGARSGLSAGIGDVTLTANPFTDAANGDFSLNTAAGGGALLRAAGFAGLFPGNLTTGYLDIGAVQHADPVGGGGGNTYSRGRLVNVGG